MFYQRFKIINLEDEIRIEKNLRKIAEENCKKLKLENSLLKEIIQKQKQKIESFKKRKQKCQK